MQLQK